MRGKRSRHQMAKKLNYRYKHKEVMMPAYKPLYYNIYNKIYKSIYFKRWFTFLKIQTILIHID